MFSKQMVAVLTLCMRSKSMEECPELKRLIPKICEDMRCTLKYESKVTITRNTRKSICFLNQTAGPSLPVCSAMSLRIEKALTPKVVFLRVNVDDIQSRDDNGCAQCKHQDIHHWTPSPKQTILCSADSQKLQARSWSFQAKKLELEWGSLIMVLCGLRMIVPFSIHSEHTMTSNERKSMLIS